MALNPKQLWGNEIQTWCRQRCLQTCKENRLKKAEQIIILFPTYLLRCFLALCPLILFCFLIFHNCGDFNWKGHLGQELGD